MRKQPAAIFRRIYFAVFLLIAMLGLLFIGVTYMATTSFYAASTQLLNKDVAGHIAKFTSPYGREGFDRQKADSVFYEAMVISPSAEVYFLDTTGRVIYFHGSPGEIQRWQVSVEPLQRYILTGGLRYISGPDPRDPDHPKIFSAAAVEGERGKLGYIYVILGNEQYRSVEQMLMNSRVTPVVFGVAMSILALSLLITILYIRRVKRRFELIENMNRVAASEKERRDFMVNISHDLRTPLAIARGYAETLVMKKGKLREEEVSEYSELVLSKIGQVEKMVGQLFELSKMESASFEMRREPFVFSEILQEVVRGRGYKIECQNCEDGSYVNADISMMERVLQNLVVNAALYSRENGRVAIRLEKTGDELIFRIENEGEPLRADLIGWLNGTEGVRPVRPAIGLEIVKKVLLLHGYVLRAEVLAGGTNVVSFRMPVYRVGEAPVEG
jgi:signal transduction histidine kinase